MKSKWKWEGVKQLNGRREKLKRRRERENELIKNKWK